MYPSKIRFIEWAFEEYSSNAFCVLGTLLEADCSNSMTDCSNEHTGIFIEFNTHLLIARKEKLVCFCLSVSFILLEPF